MLIADRVPFTAEPLSDGRWELQAEVAATMMVRIQAHVGAPVTVEAIQEEEPPAPPADSSPSPVAALLIDDEVVERSHFQATKEKAAKTRATRLAEERLGARPYPGISWQPWRQEGGLTMFVRPAYRGTKDGYIVVGVSGDGKCFLGWRGRRH
jgi:hypothetical protein